MKETVRKRFTQATATLLALVVVLSVLGPAGTVAADPGVSVAVSTDSTTVNPGDTVTITTTVDTEEVNGPLLELSLPDDWEGVVTETDGGTARPQDDSFSVLPSNAPSVVWLSPGSYEVTVEMDVPSDAAPGDYTIGAEASGINPGSGQISDSASATITVEDEQQANQPPTASIDGPTSATTGESVSFSASASDSDGSIASYSWDFDDGDSASGESVSHTFDSEGDYDVELTVTDDDGATTTATQTVSVSDATPEPDPANFQVTNLDAPATATQGDSVTVTATVENTGDEEATQTVEFSFDGSVVDSEDVTLEDDESQQVTFTVDTSGVDPGTYTHGVSTDDDEATAQITINAGSQPPAGTVDVSLSPTSETVVSGEPTTYEVVVSNVDGGVGAIDLTVSTADASIAQIVGIDSPADAGNEETTVAADGSSASVDAYGIDTDDTGSVVVATVTVESGAAGSTDLSVSADALGTESGSSYQVGATDGASIEVIPLPSLGDYEGPPQDLDDDGVYEDVNGDGQLTVTDVQAIFVNRDSDAVTENGALFDFNGDGSFTIVDVQYLFANLPE
jgi:PKD repeat protein